MAYFPQQNNYHYTRMSAKNLLLVITYPTPPYMYLREILRIPAAEPPPVRPRLLMHMTIKYIPGQGIKLLTPGYGNGGGGYGSGSGHGSGGSGIGPRPRLPPKPPKCTPRQSGKVLLHDKTKKWIVSDSTGKILLAQYITNAGETEKANFECIYYKDTSFGGNVQPISLKLGDAYLCCNENGELILEELQNGSEDLCDINGDAIKYVFLRSRSGSFAKFESAKFRDKCICTTAKDDSPRLALASYNDNEKIFEFEEEHPQGRASTRSFKSSFCTRPLTSGVGIVIAATTLLGAWSRRQRTYFFNEI
ncbi:uncharacterized protein [Hyperolius riggenbachi]|uniref:uncharacterized protein n=1 Tax=Hyperolius riggenbachi TaxID=752182 RepID=UPI0035A29509